MIVSNEVFIWFCTIMTLGIAIGWLPVETMRLKRYLTGDLSRPVIRDRLFGSLAGFAVCIVGIVGMLRYHL